MRDWFAILKTQLFLHLLLIKLKENPEKQLSPALKDGDLRRFSETDFLKSKIAKSLRAFTRIHLLP